MKLIFATGNNNKMREIREIFGDLDYEICSMKEAGVDVDIVEDADTFEGNALIKARTVWNMLKENGEGDAIVLADDSGLEIDALGGEPGVYSARYMGENTPYDIKCAEIIKRLGGKEGSERSARFRCAIACVFSDGSETVCDGKMEGIIAKSPAGENGFGYDPIFFVPELGRTSAEMSSEEKNSISHRGNALRKMREVLGKMSK